MKLYSYVVARDFGFAPNPFYGYCTLATCKPDIRRTAKCGDWIVGTGSAGSNRRGQLVFAMRVTESMDFNQFWEDERFREKRPNLRGSRMRAYGDNIYHQDAEGRWLQENSHHSLQDGSPNDDNLQHDTKTNRVLISDDFTYWGAAGPRIPERFRDWDGDDVCAGRGHRCHFDENLVVAFLSWLRSVWGPGFRGRPAGW